VPFPVIGKASWSVTTWTLYRYYTANKVVFLFVSQKQSENITLFAVHVGPSTFVSVYCWYFWFFPPGLCSLLCYYWFFCCLAPGFMLTAHCAWWLLSGLLVIDHAGPLAACAANKVCLNLAPLLAQRGDTITHHFFRLVAWGKSKGVQWTPALNGRAYFLLLATLFKDHKENLFTILDFFEEAHFSGHKISKDKVASYVKLVQKMLRL